MAPWVRRVFIHILPRLLVMRRPQYQIDKRRFVSVLLFANGGDAELTDYKLRNYEYFLLCSTITGAEETY